MSRTIGLVQFSDGHQLYCIYDHTANAVRRTLFDSLQEADAAREQSTLTPARTPLSLERVTVVPDLAHSDPDLIFSSLASRTDRYLSGPTSLWDHHDDIHSSSV